MLTPINLPPHTTLRTVAEDPDLADRIQGLIEQCWPTYVIESHFPGGDVLPTDWMGIFERWPQFQFALIDETNDELLSAGNALALAWQGDPGDLPDTGWNWAMHSAVLDLEAGRKPTSMCALSISVRSDQRNRHLSATMVEIMHEMGKAAGLRRLLAPVRPTWKSRYPITPIEEYITWRSRDGLPFDPWLRVHARLGAALVKPCQRSMEMAGSVAEWEQWTGMAFPASGHYVVPDMLTPLRINRSADRGDYVEPNVWMVHP